MYCNGFFPTLNAKLSPQTNCCVLLPVLNICCFDVLPSENNITQTMLINVIVSSDEQLASIQLQLHLNPSNHTAPYSLLIASQQDYRAYQPPACSQTAAPWWSEASRWPPFCLALSQGYRYQHFPAQTVDGNYRNQPLSTEECDAS